MRLSRPSDVVERDRTDKTKRTLALHAVDAFFARALLVQPSTRFLSTDEQRRGERRGGGHRNRAGERESRVSARVGVRTARADAVSRR